MKSLQFRLALWLGVSLALFLGIAALLLSAFPRYLTEEYVMTRIEHDADAIKQRLRLHHARGIELGEAPLGPIYSLLNSGHYFQIQTTGQTLKSPSMGDFSFQVSMLPVGENVRRHGVGPTGQHLLIRESGLNVDGKTVSLLVAEDISHMDDDIAVARIVYLSTMFLTLMGLLLAQRWIIHRSLQPLDAARAELQGMGSGENERISTEVPPEVAPLVDEVNRLTETMRQSLSRSRKALGNLAHALKAPLAVISQILDNPEEAASEEAQKVLRQQADTIRQTIDYELRRARLSAGARPGEQFNVKEELFSLVSMLGKLHEHKQLNIKLEVEDDARYPLDRPDMLELFGNLLDNACKWARREVKVIVERGERLRFTVEDDGPGVADDEYARLSERGARLDESRPGHGLGLSIVRDIVDDHGGTLRFSRASLGGLKVDVCLQT